MEAIRESALAAVDPYAAVSRYMRREGESLHIGDEVWPLSHGRDRERDAPGGRDEERKDVTVLAVGKAAVSMAAAAADLLGAHASGGVVVTKHGHTGEISLPSGFEIFETGHPIPDDAGLQAAERVIQVLSDTEPGDYVLLLLSGGGSALLPAPVEAITLDDLQQTTDLLLRAGATIVEVNAVRKHLSRLKGGQLARLAAPASLVALILSDVVGDPLDVIASGPTAPDPTTFGEALSVLARYDLLDQVPDAVAAYLKTGKEGRHPETPKPGDPVFEHVTNIIVGSNSLAAEAAVTQAVALGYSSLLLTTFIEGEAREIAKVAVALAKAIKTHQRPLAPPACLVWGGETTVTVRGSGKGGRNQELALAAALGLEGLEDVTIMALATDGTDGPTDAAGAVVDGRTASRARERGWDLRQVLQENNSYPLLADVGALLKLGPTGTNVNDLLVLLVI